VNGGYSEWAYWTPCTVTCGGGVSTRFRNCTSPSPAFGGKDCVELGAETETSSCAPDRCPGMSTVGSKKLVLTKDDVTTDHSSPVIYSTVQ
jgi:hemicentin